VDEFVHIGPDGPESSYGIQHSGDDLQRCLEQLHADLVWARTGELVGLYADKPVDLDALPPQAKRDVVDAFAADLEARREPRRASNTHPVVQSKPNGTPSAPVNDEPSTAQEAATRIATMTSSAPVVRNEPPFDDGPIAPVIELKPAVPPDVAEAALAVAVEVWAQGGRPLERFYEGRNRLFTDEWIAYAVVMGWVVVSGDGIVAPGSVNPNPPQTRSIPERTGFWGATGRFTPFL
jgi:hypothetical protein